MTSPLCCQSRGRRLGGTQESLHLTSSQHNLPGQTPPLLFLNGFMTKSKINSTVLIGAAALFFGSTTAHGYLGLPVVTFPNSVDKTQFVATIESATSSLSGSFSGSPADNAAAFWTAFKSSEYSSIKEFVADLGQIVVNGANIECGLTDPNAIPQPLPDELEWTHSDTEGFTSSHEGPCEAWCGDTQVFQDNNCAAHFTTAPAKMPFDKAGCLGASRLTFYWLALHSPTWQVYVNCAPLEGSSSSPSIQPNTTNSGSMEQSNTPTVTTAAPETTPASPTITTAAPVASYPPATTNEGGEDCGSFDVAGSDVNEVTSDVNTVEEDCGSSDVAGFGGDKIVGDVDAAKMELGSLDVAGSVSESSLNFHNVNDRYVTGKVQASYQGY